MRRARAAPIRLLPLLALFLLLLPRPAPAQRLPGGGAGDDGARSDAAVVAVLGANGLLGGLASGLASTIRGGPFTPAFLEGTLGGATVFAGKWVAAREFRGAGLLGRNIADLGTGVVRNAGAGREPLSRVRLPMGPLRIVLGAVEDAPRVTVNLSDAARLASAVAENRLELDWGRTLSAGTPVFLSREDRFLSDGREVMGATTGTQVHLYDPNRSDLPATLRHELVHVIQADFMTETVSVPVERWLLGRLGLEGRVFDRLEPGLTAFGFEALLGLPTPGRGLLWDLRENEAEWFEG